MAIVCKTFAETTEIERNDLEKRMVGFYQKTPESYYQIANQSAARYRPEDLPFHYHLATQVSPGMKVCELGCGTAHLCPEVEMRGGSYTGFDWSQTLLEENSRRFPKASFSSLEQSNRTESFDLVASLYTIEHTVNPPAYLDSLWHLCKPGGLIGIICPIFVNGTCLPPSFYYGTTARRLREKLTSLSLGDFLMHLIEMKVLAPRWARQANTLPPGAFWINLRPKILHGADYSIDSDAVHFPRLMDLEWWFKQKGAGIVETSSKLKNVNPEFFAHSCYLLVRKPALVQSL